MLAATVQPSPSVRLKGCLGFAGRYILFPGSWAVCWVLWRILGAWLGKVLCTQGTQHGPLGQTLSCHGSGTSTRLRLSHMYVYTGCSCHTYMYILCIVKASPGA